MKPVGGHVPERVLQLHACYVITKRFPRDFRDNHRAYVPVQYRSTSIGRRDLTRGEGDFNIFGFSRRVIRPLNEADRLRKLQTKKRRTRRFF